MNCTPYDVTHDQKQIKTDNKGKVIESDCYGISFHNQGDTDVTLKIDGSGGFSRKIEPCAHVYFSAPDVCGVIRTKFSVTFDTGAGDLLVTREKIKSNC